MSFTCILNLLKQGTLFFLSLSAKQKTPVRTRAFQHGSYQLFHTLILAPLVLCHGSSRIQSSGWVSTTMPPQGDCDPSHSTLQSHDPSVSRQGPSQRSASTEKLLGSWP